MAEQMQPWEYRGYMIFPNQSRVPWSIVRVSDQVELERQPTKALIRRSIDKRMGKNRS